MTIVAHRGANALADEEELRVHLASLLRLENIGLLLGAGASCSAGGKTMKSMWSSFLADHLTEAKWLVSAKFLDAACVPSATSEEAASNVATDAAPAVPDIETLGDRLEIAIEEWIRQGNDAQLKDAKSARAALSRSLVRAALLKEAWWTSPGHDVSLDGLEHHRSILQKLTSAREPGQSPPWVFTTNYDLAIEWAAETVDIQVSNGFLGLHNRRFSPQSFDLGFRNIQARGEARFGVYNIYLAKLHGSLTWKEVGDELYELPCAQAWPELQKFLDKATDDFPYLVAPRAAKYLQTVGYTFGELIRRFSEFMSRPQTALIVAGYSFGDEHVNRLLRSALLNPTLQVVVYLPEFAGNVSDPALPAPVRRLLWLQNPRLTIVGGNDQAFLSKLAEHLPDPAVFDEDLNDLKKKMARKPDFHDEVGL
ncbi:MAG: SIR2 family protein [Dokdonella sp.]|uniref:SIR2 family anti-phage-associated protein n=1 Tax=Dokdonella sp. TaxID=2291710 RepID=UPI0025BB494D|nr:SIR2 family anti-phage-associated protein [Dokdonella sp.]MBZ0223284.1 SIR2 family protein [Dokdonella sp.]